MTAQLRSRLQQALRRMHTLHSDEFIALEPDANRRLSVAFEVPDDVSALSDAERFRLALNIPPWCWGNVTYEWRQTRPWLTAIARTPAYVNEAIKRWLDAATEIETAGRWQRMEYLRWILSEAPTRLCDFIGIDGAETLALYLIAWQIQMQCGRSDVYEKPATLKALRRVTPAAVAAPQNRTWLRTDANRERLARLLRASDEDVAALIACMPPLKRRPCEEDEELTGDLKRASIAPQPVL